MGRTAGNFRESRARGAGNAISPSDMVIKVRTPRREVEG